MHTYAYTVYVRYFRQGNYHTYGHIRCTYTVLANPTHLPSLCGSGHTLCSWQTLAQKRWHGSRRAWMHSPHWYHKYRWASKMAQLCRKWKRVSINAYIYHKYRWAFIMAQLCRMWKRVSMNIYILLYQGVCSSTVASEDECVTVMPQVQVRV
jgi:hypothetical protein